MNNMETQTLHPPPKSKFKFTREDWNLLESQKSKYSVFEKHVFECLIELGNPTLASEKNDNRLVCLGERIYNIFRKELVECGLVSELDTNFTEVKMNKVEQMKFNNSMKNVKIAMNKVLHKFSEMDFRSNIYEIRGIALMQYAQKFLNDHLKKRETNLGDIYELIVAIYKFSDVTQSYGGRSILNTANKEIPSQQMMADLKEKQNQIIKTFKYSGLQLYQEFPKLLDKTKFDDDIPTACIKPREHQTELINFVSSHTEYLILYKAMIGSGKTMTTAIALTSHIQNLRNKDKTLKTRILFCCNIDSVRMTVAEICNACELNFGIAYMRNFNPYISVSQICKKEENVIMVIADPETCLELLLTDNNYILVLDEPNVGADQLKSDSLLWNMKIFQYLPKQCILSSATMPDIDQLPEFKEYYLSKHPNAVIKTICSNEISIGCEVRTFDGHLLMPFSGCKTVNELNEVINKIKLNPFLGRLFTPTATSILYDKMREEKISNLPNLKERFEELRNLTTNKVRELCLELLVILSKTSDRSVEKVCSLDMDDYEDMDSIISDNGFVESKLGTEHAHKFPNVALIATKDPLTYARTNFKELTDEVGKSCGISMRRLLKNYVNTKQKFDKTIVKLTKKIEDEDEKSKREQESKEDFHANIKFPLFAQINTSKHILRYAPENVCKLIEEPRMKDNIRGELCLELIPDDLGISDDVLMLLFCGIGIYSPSNSFLTQKYLDYVLKQASNGNLAYIISDDSICYGANYPINHVIITKDLADEHSVGTLFQLLGRSGRKGKSWMSHAYIDKENGHRIMTYVQNQKGESMEATNMNLIFHQILEDSLPKQIVKQVNETESVRSISPLIHETNQDTQLIEHTENKNDDANDAEVEEIQRNSPIKRDVIAQHEIISTEITIENEDNSHVAYITKEYSYKKYDKNTNKQITSYKQKEKKVQYSSSEADMNWRRKDN